MIGVVNVSLLLLCRAGWFLPYPQRNGISAVQFAEYPQQDIYKVIGFWKKRNSHIRQILIPIFEKMLLLSPFEIHVSKLQSVFLVFSFSFCFLQPDSAFAVLQFRTDAFFYVIPEQKRTPSAPGWGPLAEEPSKNSCRIWKPSLPSAESTWDRSIVSWNWNAILKCLFQILKY